VSSAREEDGADDAIEKPVVLLFPGEEDTEREDPRGCPEEKKGEPTVVWTWVGMAYTKGNIICAVSLVVVVRWGVESLPNMPILFGKKAPLAGNLVFGVYLPNWERGI
jgi:hypothetical protein